MILVDERPSPWWFYHNHHEQSRVLSHTTLIEWFLRVFDHLLVLCKFAITILIIVAMSLDIVYHLLYVMYLKLNVIISEPKYIYLPHSHHRDLLRHR
jgi:hypothetical protein